jgi:WD40 repeat protein
VLAISETGALAFVTQDQERRAHLLHIGNQSIPTGFFSHAKAILFREKTVWVAADHRVKAFEFGDDGWRCTTTTGGEVSIVLWGTDRTVCVWPIRAERRGGRENTLESAERKELARFAGLALEAIDWVRGVGRQPISCMCAVGELLAIVSSRHHAIHQLNAEGKVVSRLIGHTRGITSLLTVRDVAFFSGSADSTVRKWNVKHHVTEMQVHGHAEPATLLDVIGRGRR